MAQAQTVAIPRRVPLVATPQNRDESTSKDAKLVNCYLESQKTKEGTEYWVYKRPGTLGLSRPPAGNANGYGLYNWKGDIYSIFGNKLYKNDVAVSGTVDTTGGVYRFSQCLGAVPKLQLGNGVKAYNYDAVNGLVAILGATTFTAGSFVVGVSYTIISRGTTNFIAIGAADSNIGTTFTATGVGSGTGTAAGPLVITAGSFVIGTEYAILTVGTTDFTLLSAASNTIGVIFTTTGIGTGSGTAVATGANFPSVFCKGWSYLDGTTYVIRPDAGIQGDSINDPTTWDPLNVIIAQIEPDAGVALAKQLVYVIAFKQWSTEVFYDAGNATGSPLGQVQGAYSDYGCLSADSIQKIDGALYWLETNRSSAVQVVAMDQLKADVISTKPIERLLDKLDYSVVYSWQMKHDGHSFYVVTIKNANLTLAFDVREQEWHQWTDENGNYFPIVASTYDSTLRHILQHETNGRLYLADQSYYTDDGVVIHADIITPIFDGGSLAREKQEGALYVLGDQTDGSSLAIRTSDDDYQTWSAADTVDMSLKQPFLPNQGSFSRRAYWLRHSAATPMRICALEHQVDIGTA